MPEPALTSLSWIFPVCPRRTAVPCHPIEAFDSEPSRFGFSDSESSREAALHSPIGLDLEARAPEETAVSITAEIIVHANGASGLPLSLRTGPIHRAVAEILPPHTLID
ncbi:hypothetical protein CP972_03860 [Streptomyces prasinus]|uniref:XdhC Rossmann domain-containing protein n=1 Tax=Streptomyces prasinus TaxID=67345 RepID=A0ABX6B8D4_9ACTN|nr:hypothetical protein CP972_03860 [Streptomyces prasinus]